MDMVEDAVDDMYDGCNENSEEMISSTYFKKENTGIFADVWKNATDCANDDLKQKDKEDKALNKNHMQAICVYTSAYKDFYVMFNSHVRKNRTLYGADFPFHSLHFWLTSAIQILNKKTCYTAYRRTDREFTGEINQTMRFGSFASSSYSKTLTHFGNKTCFKITTCSGGFLKHYSDFGATQQEVLIPPYEMFKITDKMTGQDVDSLPGCEVLYKLQSAGVHSNLNCVVGNSKTIHFSAGKMFLILVAVFPVAVAIAVCIYICLLCSS